MAQNKNKTEEKVSKVEAEQPKTEEKKLTLKEKHEMLEIEYAELKDKYLRSAAEFENFRRRTLQEKADWIKNATKRLVLELCDISDNFERALHPDVEVEKNSFKDGVELIYQQLGNVLKKEGVEKIEAQGEEFDPNYHEALAHIPSELEENKVAAVIQSGYKMNGKVIRPARVAVSSGVKPETKTEENKK